MNETQLLMVMLGLIIGLPIVIFIIFMIWYGK